MRTASQEDRSFIHGVEAEAAATAVLMTVLSTADASYSVQQLTTPDGPALRPRVRSTLPLLPTPQLLLVTSWLMCRPKKCCDSAPPPLNRSYFRR